MAVLGYLTGTFPRFSETFIVRELRGFAASTDVAAFAVRRGADPEPRDLPPVRCLDATASGNGGSAGGVGRLLPAAWRRRFSIRRHHRLLERFVAACRDAGVGQLYAAHGDLPGLLVAAAARELDVPYSISLHARDVFCPKYDEPWLLGGARNVFTCNRRAHEQLLAREPALADRTFLVHHGLALDAWPERPEPWAPHRPFRLLYVGRLVPKKRPEYAVEALQACLRAGIDTSLAIVGDGPLRAEIEMISRGHPVSVAGIASPVEVREHMLAADCLLMCSDETDDGDSEGLPNVVLEAMATGLPVAACLTGSIPEAVDETTGWLLDADDPACVVDTVRDLQSGDEVPGRLAAARTRVTSDFAAAPLLAKRLALLQRP